MSNAAEWFHRPGDPTMGLPDPLDALAKAREALDNANSKSGYAVMAIGGELVTVKLDEN